MFSSFSGGGLWGTGLRGWLGDDDINEGMGEVALVKPVIKNQERKTYLISSFFYICLQQFDNFTPYFF